MMVLGVQLVMLIIWQVDLREGKDRPTDLGQKDCEEKGKTCGTLLQLT